MIPDSTLRFTILLPEKRKKKKQAPAKQLSIERGLRPLQVGKANPQINQISNLCCTQCIQHSIVIRMRRILDRLQRCRAIPFTFILISWNRFKWRWIQHLVSQCSSHKVRFLQRSQSISSNLEAHNIPVRDEELFCNWKLVELYLLKTEQMLYRPS